MYYGGTGTSRTATGSITSSGGIVKLPHERFDYSPIAARKPWKLPKDARIAVWQSIYANAIEKLTQADSRDRHSGGVLVMRSDTGNP